MLTGIKPRPRPSCCHRYGNNGAAACRRSSCSNNRVGLSWTMRRATWGENRRPRYDLCDVVAPGPRCVRNARRPSFDGLTTGLHRATIDTALKRERAGLAKSDKSAGTTPACSASPTSPPRTQPPHRLAWPRRRQAPAGTLGQPPHRGDARPARRSVARPGARPATGVRIVGPAATRSVTAPTMMAPKRIAVNSHGPGTRP